MKHVIQQLTQMTEDSIKKAPLEALLTWQKKHDLLKETAEAAWEAFSLLESQPSEERILQLMKNYASGAVNQKFQQFLAAYAALNLPSPANDVNPQNQFSPQNFKKMAEFYLENYLPQREKLVQNSTLIHNQINKLECPVDISRPTF